MKGMKVRLLKKIQSIKPVGYLALENRVLQVSASNGFFVNNSCETNLGAEIQNKPICQERTEQKKNKKNCSDLDKEEEEEEEEEELMDDKENNCPEIAKVLAKRASGSSDKAPLTRFRRPDPNSHSLFDPNLLAEFRRAVAEHSLSGFPEKCPPGGSEGVILYTTTLRGIRKTFEGCAGVRFLLESFRVAYAERDVSMHAGFRDEMRRVLGDGAAVPPRLFVRGRYIGGAKEVLGLHERGELRPLFDGVPIARSDRPCEGCGGARFAVCFGCSGSHKVRCEDGDYNVCPDCNENGLIVCPLCC